jgi:transposase InsO family protein
VQPRPFRTTTIRGEHDVTVPDLVQRDFTAERPGTKLVGDITYIRTWHGWLYLATVIDCFNREVVGYAMADHMRTELVTAALTMAAQNHDLEPDCIMHSDSEYVWAGVPGLPDPHSDGHARMLVPGAPGLPDPHFRLTTVVFPRICRLPGSTW